MAKSKIGPYKQKDTTEISGFKKVPVVESPYRREETDVGPDMGLTELQKIAEEDSDLMYQLAKENKIDEMNELINRRMDRFESDPRFSEAQAGLATRDYLENIFGKGINKQMPQLKNMSTLDAAEALRTQIYPGLRTSLKKFRPASGITVNRPEISQGKPVIDSYGNVVLQGSLYNPETGDINLSDQGFYNPDKRSATIAHELAHSFDDLGAEYVKEKESFFGPSREKEEAVQKMLKLKPAYSKILSNPSSYKEERSLAEGGATNRPAPNFQDYDFTSGKFKSYIKKLPASIQDELATEHHGRNYPLEGIKTLSKGGFDKLVESSPRFKKLRALIS